MDKAGICFRTGMTGHELAEAIKALDRGLDGYAQEIALDRGEFVIYLRKPTLRERITLALMPDTMKRERMETLSAVIRQAAARVHFDGDQLLHEISSGNSRAACKAIRDAGIKVALKNAERNNIV